MKKKEQFIILEFDASGFRTGPRLLSCERGTCDSYAYYRVRLGAFERLFCEPCLTEAFLAHTPPRPSTVPLHHEGYMNPDGGF